MTYNGFDTLTEALDAHSFWMKGEKSGKRLDLRGASLSGACLHGLDLAGAYLSGASLSGADFSRADLSGADLSGADLSRADLGGARILYANLRGASLRGADIVGAYLSLTDLSGAYLSTGVTWERYLSEIVPALLTAGGKTIEEVVSRSWDCNSWKNCPMAVAFGVHRMADIPPLYQREAGRFVTLFDSKQIPNPLAPKTEVTE